jgi:hypothetical protein
MFDLEKDYENAIQKVTIQIGDLLGKPKADVYLTFCEPNTFDTLKMNSVDKTKPEELVGYFDGIFDRILVDHNFLKGDSKVSNAEVHQFIFKKFNVTLTIASQYLKEVFLSPQSKTKEK